MGTVWAHAGALTTVGQGSRSRFSPSPGGRPGSHPGSVPAARSPQRGLGVHSQSGPRSSCLGVFGLQHTAVGVEGPQTAENYFLISGGRKPNIKVFAGFDAHETSPWLANGCFLLSSRSPLCILSTCVQTSSLYEDTDRMDAHPNGPV